MVAEKDPLIEISNGVLLGIERAQVLGVLPGPECHAGKGRKAFLVAVKKRAAECGERGDEYECGCPRSLVCVVDKRRNLPDR
jgi:hypothetical protein